MAWMSRISWLLGNMKDVEMRIVLIGLPNSGKSTLMLQLKPPNSRMIHIHPAVPIDDYRRATQFRSRAMTFVSFDLDAGGSGSYLNPWEDFYRSCRGIIFVVDASQCLRIPKVKEELERLLEDPLIKSHPDIPLLVLANKMDQPNAVTAYQLSISLGLEELCRRLGGRPWHVTATDGLTGEGLHEALDWFIYRVKDCLTESETT